MSEFSKRRILVVDDHQVIRAGLLTSLSANGWSEIYQASSFKEACNLIAQEEFPLIVTDQYLGDGEGINLATLAKKVNPATKMVLFTFEASWALIERARTLEFSLFISKESSLNTIMTALDEVRMGRDGLAIYAPSLPRKSIILAPLTKSEIEVLSLLSQGLTAREIAVIRYSAEATIKSHVCAILRKLQSRNRVEAIQKARQMSLIATS
jgi:DNA-binding NarL/FixJ family response regulator